MLIEQTHTTLILSVLYQEKAFEEGIIDTTKLKDILQRPSSQIEKRLKDMVKADLIQIKKVKGFPTHNYIWLTEIGKTIGPIAKKYLDLYKKLANDLDLEIPS